MTALLSALRRLWGWASRLGRRIARLGGSLSHRATSRAAAFAIHARRRLTDRWHGDSTYRRTVIAALSAVAATLIPHPSMAAALGALIAERPTRPASRRDPFADDLDEDDEYPPRRARLDPWTPSPRRLWDALE